MYGRVYDVTKFGPKHPGGDIIYEVGGTEATMKHADIGHSMEAYQLLSKFQIGVLKGWKAPPDLEWPPYIQPLPQSKL